MPFEQMKISISNCPPGLYVLAEIAKVASLVTKRRNVTLTQCGEYGVFVYTTQVNSTFRARWLASSKVISQVLFTSEQSEKNKLAFVGILSQIKLLFGSLVIQLV